MNKIIYFLILSPALVFIFDPVIEYNWVIDNLQGLTYLFKLYYLFLFIYLLYKKEFTFILILIISYIVFISLSVNEDIKYNGILKEIEFSTFQYNMYFNEKTIDGAIKIIKSKNPDILVFQEVTPTIGVKLHRILNNKYPYSIGRKPTEGFPSQQLFMSKFPILGSKIEEFSKRKYRFITGTLNIKNKKLFFYIMHPPSPKTKTNWEMRNKLFKMANKTLKEQHNPFILIGDLNISNSSNQFNIIFEKKYYNYNTLDKEYTWSAFCIPYIYKCIISSKIDHSITSKNIFLKSKKSYIKERHSDHLPIYSEFLYTNI